jgi:hypothetical protein
MRRCSNCGKVLDDDADRCPECGSSKLTLSLETRKPEPVTAIIAPPPEPKAAPAATVEEEPEPVSAWQGPLPWSVLAAVVILLGIGAGWFFLSGRPQVPVKTTDPNAVELLVRQKLEKLIQEYLPEKLEWGRELLKKRSPNRFPEELALATNETKADVEYVNPEKTAAAYGMQIAYHFPETPRKSYQWQQVTFFFEQHQGKWVLTGDKWPNDWDLNFE